MGEGVAPGPLLEAHLGNQSVFILDLPLRREYWSDWSFFSGLAFVLELSRQMIIIMQVSLSLLSSENVHAFTHVVLFIYHTGINLLTVHVFFNKWLVVSCGRQMFCCLHSSFLGELTLILLLLLFISATMQDFYILVLSLVFKETHYFILLEHPQK